jgi:S1-C subfamily serine protease
MPNRLLLLAAFVAFAITPHRGEAQNRRPAAGPVPVTVINRAASAVQHLYITPSESLPWGEDRLGKETLAAGARQVIRVDRTAGCRYDIRAVYSDGDTDIDTDVNLCGSGGLTLTGDKAVSALRLVRLAARRPVSLFMLYNRTGVEMTQLTAGETRHLDGMTVDAGDNAVGRFRRDDGCKANLVAELKEGDPVFVEAHDLCATPVVSFVASDRKFAIRMRNRSAYPLVSLHVRPSGFASWGGDRLGSDTLQPRDMKRINVATTATCLFDVKSAFGQGEDEVRNGVNLCDRKIFDIDGPELVTGKGDKKTPQAPPAEREVLPIRITNELPRTIREIFVSPARTKNWGENLIDSPLARGKSAALGVDQSSTCLFDVKAVYEGGREQRRMNLDLCKTESLSIGGPFDKLIDGGGPEVGVPVSFTNTGRAEVQSLYLTPSNDTHWGEDRLGSNALERRSRLNLRLPQAGGCFWDVKVGFGEGIVDESRRVNICDAPEQQLKKREKPGAVISTGSGFFISPEGHVLTNSHVVEGCRIVAIARDGEPRIPLEVVRDDPEIDIALLRASRADGPFIALRGQAEAPVRPGERAIVVGYPVRSKLGVVNVTEGVVSAAGARGQDITRLQFTAPAQPGNSGGPILDSAGRAIGVVVARLGTVEDERLSQNINFGVSAGAVEAFLKDAGISLNPAQDITEKATPAIFDAANAAVLPLDCLE